MDQGLYDSQYEHDSCGVGFIANIAGKRSHDVIHRGLEILTNMKHRGAYGADSKTGDGAGITIQIPDRYYQQAYDLPIWGNYATGLVFLPNNPDLITQFKAVFEQLVTDEGMTLLFWRKVPVNDMVVGEVAKESEPYIVQPFIQKDQEKGRRGFERKLFILRKLAEKWARYESSIPFSIFHICSLSSYKITFKGLVLPENLSDYYLDLKNPLVKSAIALVHSRFSTNTFPTWDLAQPFRYLAHNGEINTVRSNRLWMRARESMLHSDLLGDDLKRILPILDPNASDSLSLDNVLELLVLSGKTIPEALLILIPEAWSDSTSIPESLKACFEYHGTFMEAWGGPAAVAFTDGEVIGATLDRNGLRPARYVITNDGMFILASEVGVLRIPPKQIQKKGRLEPGKMVLVDTEEGRFLSDTEVKLEIAAKHPYQMWLSEHAVSLDTLSAQSLPDPLSGSALDLYHSEFGYLTEELKVLLSSMVKSGKEPTGSMGNDTPIAVLSTLPQRLFNYFKQMFAQVTNPAVDPLREGINMNLITYLGRRENILNTSPANCRSIKITRSILTHAEAQAIKENPDFKHHVLSLLYPVSEGGKGLEKALQRLCEDAEAAIQDGVELLYLSDRNFSKTEAPIPCILAASALHHYLIEKGVRILADLIIETGDVREPMHAALLFGLGSDAIYPYLALDTAHYLAEKTDLVGDLSPAQATENLQDAFDSGVLKIMSKMGISSLRSYRSSQLFECVGLSSDVVNQYFPGISTRLDGLSLDDIAKEQALFHDATFNETPAPVLDQKPRGLFKYRNAGEFHGWNPKLVVALQKAVREQNYDKFKEYATMSDTQNQQFGTLRGLLRFNTGDAIPLDQVESVESIMKRFTTGAMSFGALSKEAHETLAIAMNKIGGKSNSGEGGEDPARFIPREDGSSARSAIKQIASGRFGVTTHYMVNADELQIKIAQGAKPGEGGQLPGFKVDEIIAKVRHSTKGITLISPPPHHDIYSIEDLSQLIFDLRSVNPNAEISVKLVSIVGVGTVAAGVVKAFANRVCVSGYDGGTGASPLSSLMHAGVPWELGISEVQQTLVQKNLRNWVKLQTDGQMRTGRDVVIAALLGAEEFGFSTAALVSVGCVMARVCHNNTCPTGVATQDPALREKFKGKPEHVVTYMTYIAQQVRELLAELGVTSLDDIIGNTDFLRFSPDAERWKTQTLDFSKLLFKPKNTVCNLKEQRSFLHGSKQLGHDLKILSQRAIDLKEPTQIKTHIRNEHRATGAMLSGEVVRKWGPEGLPDNTIHAEFVGTAGQSFGAFLCKGITFALYGDANDYVGKGLSGGRVVIAPPKSSLFKAERNVIIGNTCFYGATSGNAYIRGQAGERFCVRNSGVEVVVEGVGEHGCEYMTGGRVVILGEVGRNFGAGMSGGIAYIYAPRFKTEQFCNLEMVSVTKQLNEDDVQFLQEKLQDHIKYTDSAVANKILNDWEYATSSFCKVVPLEYQKMITKQQEAVAATKELA